MQGNIVHCCRLDKILLQEIVQDPETTIEDVKGCIKDGHYYPTGCQIEVSCKPGNYWTYKYRHLIRILGYYPKDKTYLHRPGSQVLSCQSGGRGWADQYYRAIATRFECVKGCIPPPTSRDTNTNTQTITNNFFIDGVRVKCTTSKHTHFERLRGSYDVSF